MLHSADGRPIKHESRKSNSHARVILAHDHKGELNLSYDPRHGTLMSSPSDQSSKMKDLLNMAAIIIVTT